MSHNVNEPVLNDEAAWRLARSYDLIRQVAKRVREEEKRKKSPPSSDLDSDGTPQASIPLPADIIPQVASPVKTHLHSEEI